MPAACALGIFSGKFILYFRIAERLRAFRYLISREKIMFRSAALAKAALQIPLARLTPPVKMRLERSASATNAKIINNSSAIDMHSAAEHIKNRFTVRFVWTSP